MADGSSESNGLGSLRSVADGATLHTAGTILVNVLGFVLNLVLTRTLGASIYGIYAYGTMVIAALLTFANVGTDVSLTRYLAANHEDPAYQSRMLGLAYATTFICSIAIALVLFAAAPTINAYTLDQPLFTPALQVFAIALPFQAGTHLASSTVRGLELPVEKTVILVAGPKLQLIAIAGAVAVGYSVLGVAAAYVLACLMAFLFAAAYSMRRTGLRPTPRFRRDEVTDFYNYSGPLTVSKASSFLFKRIDIFMIGIFLAAADVGIYNIAVLLAGVIAMPLAGVNQLFPPVASRLYSNDEVESLESVYSTVTRWSISASLLIALPLFVYRVEILSLFGPEFVAGATVVTLFVAGQLFNAAAGPSNDLLTMTDHQYAVMANHFTFGCVNVTLNYVLIQWYGLVGAALATAGVLAALNVVRVLEVWYFEGMFAYSIDIWKPVAAAAVAALAMVMIGSGLEGFPLVVTGSVIGCSLFLCALYLFGIDDRDKELANEYVDLVS